MTKPFLPGITELETLLTIIESVAQGLLEPLTYRHVSNYFTTELSLSTIRLEKRSYKAFKDFMSRGLEQL